MQVESYTLYILDCSGRYYTGIAKDINARLKKHKSGKGARFTKSFKPSKLLACWKVEGGRGKALMAEAAVKKLRRVQKESIVSSPKEISKYIPNHNFEFYKIKD